MNFPFYSKTQIRSLFVEKYLKKAKQKSSFNGIQSKPENVDETQMENIKPNTANDDLYTVDTLCSRWNNHIETIDIELETEYKQIKNPTDLTCNEATKDYNYKKSKYKAIYPCNCIILSITSKFFLNFKVFFFLFQKMITIELS